MSLPNHSFSIELAEKYGIECAIMIQHFSYWIKYNRQMKKNFHEGRTWMYDKLEDIAGHFPYWNKDKVFRIIQKLEELGIIIKGNFNKSQFVKTIWYAFENEKMFTVLQNCNIEIAELQNGDCESAKCIYTHTTTHTTHVCNVPETPALNKCDKTKPDGSKFSLSLEDVFSHSVLEKRDWTSAEIKQAWEIFENYKNPISDWFKFIDGTIKKIRIKQNNTKQDKKPCHKNTTSTKTLKQPSKRNNEFYSENGTSESPLAIYARQNGLK